MKASDYLKQEISALRKAREESLAKANFSLGAIAAYEDMLARGADFEIVVPQEQPPAPVVAEMTPQDLQDAIKRGAQTGE